MTTAGNVGIGTTGPGELFAVSASGGDSAYFAGEVGIGTQNPSRPMHIVMPETVDNNAIWAKADNSSTFASALIYATVARSANTAYSFFRGDSGGAGTDIEHNLRGDGTPLSDLAATTPADVAEWTRVVGDPSSYEPGDLVMISRTHPRHVEKAIAGKDTEPLLMGAVTLMPGLVGVSFDVADDVTEGIGSKTDEELEKEWNAKKIANIGYVPLKVSMEGGSLQPGDPITASSIPGVGKKAKSGQKIVGYAFDPFDPLNNKMGIHNQDLKMPTQGKFLHAETKPITLLDGTPSYQGWVFGYVNLGYSKLDVNQESGIMNQGSTGWSIDPATGQISSNGFGLDMAGADIMNVKAIMSASGKWRIGEDGKLFVQELEVRGKGITVYDRATGQPKCVFVENDIVRSEEGTCVTPD